jgi:type I restriction enzyme M protein
MGRAGVVLANGSMSSSQNNEGTIRREMIERDAVECMVALPAQLFFNTQIPACLWFLSKDKGKRKGEILFIDARKLGRLENRVNRVFDEEDIQKIADTYHSWGKSEPPASAGGQNLEYEDIPGFCRSANLEEVRSHDYILTPGRYVGAEDVADDDEAFAEKMERLASELCVQFEKSSKLEQQIKHNLASTGFEIRA